MENSQSIVRLYKAVFDRQKNEFGVSPREIMDGIREIGEAYAPDPEWENRMDSVSTYYENAAHRCAYLHKYAMVHTGLLCDLLDQALKVYPVKEVLGSDYLRVCSLGSGPGTDIVAFFLILRDCFGSQRIHATLIDCCNGWKSVFETIISELRGFPDVVSRGNFQYEYVVTDLLDFDGQDPLLNRSISSADVVTMVKFVSAAACRDTMQMVKNLFRVMKPGALLLFVDNAAGRFHEMVTHAAEECRMKSVFGPLNHYAYKENAFCRNYCNWISQYETKVAVEIWKKVEPMPWNVTSDLQRQFFERPQRQTYDLDARFTDEDFPTLITIDSGSFTLESKLTPVEVEKNSDQKCCIIM